MSVIGSNIIAGASGTVETGYQISRSLRFNSADSAALTRTLAASSRTTWTFSGWLKRAVTGADNFILSASGGTSNDLVLNFYINSSDKFVLDSYTNTYRVSTQVFRDVGAWYHLVVVWDTNNATAQNRARVWVNNTEITAWDTNATIASGQLGGINGAYAHGLGRREGINDKFFSGYMADVRFIDGQALTPSSFGETDSATGVWVPKAYTGTYGTNGFWLKFDDNSGTTSTTLGKDSSGNGNNWTPNNFSVTAGAGNDSLVDSPTNYGTDTGAGGEVRGNYCTFNPLDNNVTLANGNLDASRATASWASVRSTFGMTSGKWYWEILCTVTPSASNGLMVGIATSAVSLADYIGASATGYAYNGFDAKKYNNGASSAYGATFTNNDVIGVGFDADAGTLTFYKNGVSQGSAYTGLTSGPYFAAISLIGTASASINCGQRPFAYTAPSGFKALCTQNLPTPTIGTTSTTLADDYFNAVAYSGNSSTQTITTGFQPDLVWIKSRSTADVHTLQNVISGARYYLISNSTAAEATQPDSDGVSSFTSTGFSLGYTDSDAWNKTGNTYISWSWKAGGTGVSNTAGSISSTVSASTTAGFSVVAYTGTGANATVGHGLGKAPSMIIVKNRDQVTDWLVGHSSLTSWAFFLKLNATSAQASASTVWNSTAPTSTLFSIGTDGGVNSNTIKYVAYCFAEIAGFSKFGSYTGNLSTDGPFVYCGFRPRFLLVKNSSAAGSWWIEDSSRSAYNVGSNKLAADSSAAENTGTANFDFLSNGFKVRNSGTELNGSGNTIIFMAFAETPLNFARAR